MDSRPLSQRSLSAAFALHRPKEKNRRLKRRAAPTAPQPEQSTSPHERKETIRVARPYVLIAVLVGTAVLAVSSASAWTPTRAGLNERRHHVMDMREARCLWTWPLPKLPPDMTAALKLKKWNGWGRVKERTLAKGSRCLSATLMDWYYTSGAKCVHEHEGAWTSNTGNGYYGGFQANLSFQAAYGAEYYPPTADAWTPLQQIHMAYRGWKVRGWSPWPNTAAACGLL